MENRSVIGRESELLLDCLDFDILIINDRFEILFANRSFLNTVGSKSGEVLGRYCYEVTHHIDSQCKPPNDPCPINLIKTTMKPTIELHTHYSKDNRKFMVNVIAAPILLDQKSDTFLHVALPVTEGADASADLRSAMIKTLDILMVIQSYQDKIRELNKTKKELAIKMTEIGKINQYVSGKDINLDELKNKINKLNMNI